MPSELLIAYPDIPLRAASITNLALGESATHTRANLVSGARAQRFEAGSSGTQAIWRYDLGASVTSSVEYLFIAGANILRQQGADRVFLRRFDGVSTTDVIGRTSLLSSATFTGPRSEDLMCVSGFNNQVAGSFPSTASRYWDVVCGHSSTSALWGFRKLYCGTFFDFGRSPVYPAVVQRPFASIKNRDARYVYDITWDGITDAVRNDFYLKLWRYADLHPVVLWDSTNCILNGVRTLHCQMTEIKVIPMQPNVNTISITFEEMI